MKICNLIAIFSMSILLPIYGMEQTTKEKFDTAYGLITSGNLDQLKAWFDRNPTLLTRMEITTFTPDQQPATQSVMAELLRKNFDTQLGLKLRKEKPSEFSKKLQDLTDLFFKQWSNDQKDKIELDDMITLTFKNKMVMRGYAYPARLTQKNNFSRYYIKELKEIFDSELKKIDEPNLKKPMSSEISIDTPARALVEIN